MKELPSPVQLNLGLFPSEHVIFSKELLDKLANTSPMDLLPPEERKHLRDTLDESYRIRIQAENELLRTSLF